MLCAIVGRKTAEGGQVARTYVVDETYRDSTNLSQNQFYHWLGVKNSGGIRPATRKDGTVAFLVLVSTHVSVATYNPWDDSIDPYQGRIWYWGDAKAHATKKRDDWAGNQYLQRVWEAVNEQRWSDVPPILHFMKVAKGSVEFTGLCVLAELRDAWMEDGGKRVRNHRAVIDVLPVREISVEWLRRRQRGEQPHQEPPEWRRYAESGEHSRLVVFARKVRNANEQLPADGSVQRATLAELAKLDPIKFERLVVKAFQSTAISHEIAGTKPTGDGGFDFFGAFRLPPPLSYTIPVKGEVKRYKLDGSGVGPKDVARLVARLQRGEHGIFATTSYFTQQAQQEVYADRYPVELIPGARLAGLLAEVGAVRKGVLQSSWLETIS